MARFIQVCLRRGDLCRLTTTSTVRLEARDALRRVVDQRFDRVGIQAYTVRSNIEAKCSLRLNSLFTTRGFTVLSIHKPLTKRVHRFYEKFAKRKDARLFKLQMEKGRVSLIPSRRDMTILGEAARLAEDHTIIFVTEDGDFTSFKDEVKTEFNVEILNLRLIPPDKRLIENFLRSR